jgi:putative FmdB family regulatory protein
MPTYEYKCPDCDFKIQVVRGIKDDDPGYECETCKTVMKKVFFIGAVTFNGSGFYSKDK